MEALLAAGHAGALDYTPRQVAAFVALAARRRKREAAEKISIAAVAGSGKRNVDKAIRDLQKE